MFATLSICCIFSLFFFFFPFPFFCLLCSEYLKSYHLSLVTLLSFHLSHPYATIIQHIANIIVLNKGLSLRWINKKHTLILSSFIASLMLFCSLCRSKFLIYIIFLSAEELLLTFLEEQICLQ